MEVPQPGQGRDGAVLLSPGIEHAPRNEWELGAI